MTSPALDNSAGGAAQAATLIANRLRTGLPATVTVDDHEDTQRAIDEFPLVEVVILDDRVVSSDYDPQDRETIRVAYTVRIFTTVLGHSYDETDTRRKTLALQVRNALIRPGGHLDVDRLSLRTSYSSITAADSGTYAAAFLQATVTIDETIDPLRAGGGTHTVTVVKRNT